MRPAELRVHIRQLCCLGVTGEQLMPALLKAVRQLVGAESAALFWVDAHGDIYMALGARERIDKYVRQS